nr:L-threonylcarbamoyladenylate synthase [Sinobaca sp. H24]
MSYTHTKIWTVDKNKKTLPSDPSIVEAADYIKRGEVVAFPTETVYGLGADASSREAVDKIFAAKGRPGDNPLIVHIADYPHLDNLNVQVDDVERRLMKAFWPGPLTIVLHGSFPVSANVTAGLDTLAVPHAGPSRGACINQSIGKSTCCTECQFIRQAESDESVPCNVLISIVELPEWSMEEKPDMGWSQQL